MKRTRLFPESGSSVWVLLAVTLTTLLGSGQALAGERLICESGSEQLTIPWVRGQWRIEADWLSANHLRNFSIKAYLPGPQLPSWPAYYSAETDELITTKTTPNFFRFVYVVDSKNTFKIKIPKNAGKKKEFHGSVIYVPDLTDSEEHDEFRIDCKIISSDLAEFRE